jgi:hypothetical protein
MEWSTSGGCEMKSSTLGVRGIVAVCSIAGLAAFSSSVYADQIFSASNGTLSGTADFTVTSGNINIILTNNTNTQNLAQLLSDLSFSVGGATVANTSVTPTGSPILCSDGGCVSGGTINHWNYSATDGSFLLTGLHGLGNSTPQDFRSLIIGPVDLTTYCKPGCPDGIANVNNQPYIYNTATFNLAVAGLAAGSTVTNVAFSFGTGPETVVGVPIPAAAWLFGSGLLGLIGIARRRITGANPPALA